MEIKKIYFDMDNVLADFSRGVRELCNMPDFPYSENTDAQDEQMWAAIKNVEHFYDKLELMNGAMEMFKAVYEKYKERCEVLTGIPKPKRGIVTAGADKTSWVHRLLAPDMVVNIVFAEDKKNFCTGPECVLIDDLEKNINAWVECGGTGILCESPARAMEIMREKGIIQ